MELVCGSARFTLQTLPVGDYPSLPSMPESTGTVRSDAFAQAVAQVVVAAGRDELLPVFTGVRVEIDGDLISLLATDRYRMALKELRWNPASTQVSATALVPAKVLSDTSKSMVAGEDIILSLATPVPRDGIIGFEGHGSAGQRGDHDATARRRVSEGSAHHEHARADERTGQDGRAHRCRQAGCPRRRTEHRRCGCWSATA